MKELSMHAKLSRYSNLFLTCAACCLLFNCAVSAANPDAMPKHPSIADRVKKLDPFFKQYVPVGGTMVAGSEKAPTFCWPEGLAEKFYAIEDQKKLRAKKRYEAKLSDD